MEFGEPKQVEDSLSPNTFSSPRYQALVFCGSHYLLCLLVELTFYHNHQEFSSEIWRTPDSARHVSYDLTPRQRMLDDLVENVLPGSTKSEIETLLGASTNTGYFSKSERDLIYVLGMERGLGVDSEWLLIWFDDLGNFERYEIATD